MVQPLSLAMAPSAPTAPETTPELGLRGQAVFAPIAFGAKDHFAPQFGKVTREELTKKPVFEYFYNLVEKVTPSAHPDLSDVEEKNKRLEAILDYQIDAYKAMDPSGEKISFLRGAEHNLPPGMMIVRVKGSPGYEDRKPLVMVAHNDIVPADITNPFKAITPTIEEIKGEDWIVTDGTTTLGADNKAGGASAMAAVHYFMNNPDEAHVPLEIMYMADEEIGSKSLGQFNSSLLKAKYALIPDGGDGIHQMETGLAGTSKIDIKIEGLLGGHSGLVFSNLEGNSLARRVSAADVLFTLGQKLKPSEPKGQQEDPNSHVSALAWNVHDVNVGKNAHNQIPKTAGIGLYMRSATEEDKARGEELLKKAIAETEAEYNAKLDAIRSEHGMSKDDIPELKINYTIEHQYPNWPYVAGSPFIEMMVNAVKKLVPDRKVIATTNLGAAVNNIFAQLKNADGEKFESVLVGAEIPNMHAVSERVKVSSLEDLKNLMVEVVKDFTQSTDLK